MLCCEPEPNLRNKCSSAFCQFFSLGRKFQRNPHVKFYHQSIDSEVGKRFVEIMSKPEFNSAFGKILSVPHHPVVSPIKPSKVGRVCDTATKFKEVSFNNKQLAGPHLLHELTGEIFRFRAGTNDLTADIGSMFPQVRATDWEKCSLIFLGRSEFKEPVQGYDCQLHVFEQKFYQCARTTPLIELASFLKMNFWSQQKHFTSISR